MSPEKPRTTPSEGPSELNSLLNIGETQGYLTPENILSVLPDAGEDIDRLETLLDRLEDAGISIQEETISEEESDDLVAKEPDKETITLLLQSANNIGIYLQEISQTPLLTHEEEISLAKRMRAGKRARKELAFGVRSEIHRLQLQSKIEDATSAQHHLIKANTRLVIPIAKKHTNRGVSFLDLIQEGNLGLIRATFKYDYTRGFRFSTYATWWIRQSITLALADQSRTIRVPVHASETLSRVRKLSYLLSQQLGREPTLEELAQVSDINQIKLKMLLKADIPPVSLNTPYSEAEEDGSELAEVIGDHDSLTPEDQTAYNLLRQDIQELLHNLPVREAQVLCLRYGLQGNIIHTLEETGKKLGFTRERARQLEAQALQRVRSSKYHQKLEGHLHS